MCVKWLHPSIDNEMNRVTSSLTFCLGVLSEAIFCLHFLFFASPSQDTSKSINNKIANFRTKRGDLRLSEVKSPTASPTVGARCWTRLLTRALENMVNSIEYSFHVGELYMSEGIYKGP
jgi:hypothetical protein